MWNGHVKYSEAGGFPLSERNTELSEVQEVHEGPELRIVGDVYLVLYFEPTTDGSFEYRRIGSFAFNSLEEARGCVQRIYNNQRQHRGQPPETLVWEHTIAKRPNGSWIEDIDLRITPMVGR
jgi:hypothetical protein